MFRLIQKIRAFMQGRNGFDRLVMFTLLAYMFFNGIKMWFRFYLPVFFSLWAIAIAFLLISVFRFLSKNLERRRYEAANFERFLVRINFDGFVFAANKKLKRMSMRLKHIRTHRFRTCPQCKRHLRLSRKRGIRRITCPDCGRKFKRLVIF